MIYQAHRTVGELIALAKEDLAFTSLPRESAFYDSLNDTLTRLYREVICEKLRCPLQVENGVAATENLTLPNEYAPVCGEDISAVWNGDRQLRFLPYTLLSLGGTGYYTVYENQIILGDDKTGYALDVDIILRPARLSEQTKDMAVPFPDEFLSLLLCRLRGDICRLAGEDAEAAKWLGEYNSLLEEFCLFVKASRERRKG